MKFLTLVALVLVSLSGLHAVSAQEAPTPRAAFDALEQRGLTVGGGIDNATMIDRIEAGDLEDVGLFLSAGINPNLKDEQGRLPLAIAAALGRADIARLLVEAGADLDLTDR